MPAVLDIVAKNRTLPLALAAIEDFDLVRRGEMAAADILSNPAISLYCLDFAAERAVFVQTPPALDLSDAPFYFMAQYDAAQQVITMPFAELKALARSIPLDDQKLISVYTVGRAGSTLAGRVAAQVPGVQSVSEPDALTNLVAARGLKLQNEADLQSLLDATMRVLCKTPAAAAWVVKGRSFVIELADWLYALYPRARNLFLYRDAASWLVSGLRAFDDGVARSAEDELQRDRWVRETFSPLAPLLARVPLEQHLPPTGYFALIWLSAMEAYERVSAAGVPFLAIRYDDWREAPQQTAVAMLEYCDLHPADWKSVYAALAQDSQAGTALAQETVQERHGWLEAAQTGDLQRYLDEHSFINTADFEAKHTWQRPVTDSR